MTPDQISQIASLPIMGVLIFLLVRESGRVDKLLQVIIDQNNQHAAQLAQVRRNAVGVALNNQEEKATIDEQSK